MNEQTGRLLLGAEVAQELPVAPPARQGVEYRGGRGLFGLLLKNTLLGIVTVGIYRFWARTALRRYFWASVHIDGEPLEYTGKGSELFVGFLVVMAVLVPVTIIYSGIQAMSVGNATMLGVLDVFYVIALSLLIAAGQYRARRYRLSRTVWRGIRAAQDGSTWTYVGRHAVWTVAFILTLGLSAPWAATNLARYRIEHTSWGDQRGRFEGYASDLLRPWMTVWLLLFLPPLFVIAIIASAALKFGFSADLGSLFNSATIGYSAGTKVALVGLGLVSWLMVPIAFIYFSFDWLRWYIGGTRLGFLELTARFRPFRLTLRLVLSYFLMLILLLVVMMLVSLLAGAAASFSKFSMENLNPATIFAVAAAFLVFYVFGGIATTMLITVPILCRIVNGIAITGLEQVDSVLQSTQSIDRAGEGLADSFDIGIG